MSVAQSAFELQHENENDSVRRSSQRQISRISLLDYTPRSKYFCFIIPVEWIVLPEEGDDFHLKNSDLSTTFLLVNAMIGAGILVQGYVFSESGILSCCVEYIIVGVMIYMGVEMMIQCAASQQIFDYPKLAGHVLGVYGKLAVDLSIVINGAGALLSYILIIGTLFEDIVSSFSTCDAWYCNIAFLTILPIVTFTIPLCLIRNFGHLAVISYISVSVITSIVFLVIIGGPVVGHNSHSAPTSVKMGSFVGSIRNVGDIIFALGYSTAAFHAYNGMENRSVANFQRLAKTATWIGVLMCFFTGLAAYLSFGNDTDTNILLNFTGAVGDIFKLALIVHLVLYIPGDFVILRASLWRLFDVDVATQSNTLFISTTLGSVGLITMVAILLQVYCSNSNALGLVVDITGGMAGSIVYFLVPGLMGWKLFHPVHGTHQLAIDNNNKALTSEALERSNAALSLDSAAGKQLQGQKLQEVAAEAQVTVSPLMTTHVPSNGEGDGEDSKIGQHDSDELDDEDSPNNGHNNNNINQTNTLSESTTISTLTMSTIHTTNDAQARSANASGGMPRIMTTLMSTAEHRSRTTRDLEIGGPAIYRKALGLLVFGTVVFILVLLSNEI